MPEWMQNSTTLWDWVRFAMATNMVFFVVGMTTGVVSRSFGARRLRRRKQ